MTKNSNSMEKGKTSRPKKTLNSLTSGEHQASFGKFSNPDPPLNYRTRKNSSPHLSKKGISINDDSKDFESLSPLKKPGRSASIHYPRSSSSPLEKALNTNISSRPKSPGTDEIKELLDYAVQATRQRSLAMDNDVVENAKLRKKMQEHIETLQKELFEKENKYTELERKFKDFESGQSLDEIVQTVFRILEKDALTTEKLLGIKQYLSKESVGSQLGISDF